MVRKKMGGRGTSGIEDDFSYGRSTMNITRWAAVVASVLVLLAVGCRTAPRQIYEVDGAKVTASRALSIDEVEKAVKAAGISSGWQMIQRGPGNIEGVYTLRQHKAVVDIKYDTNSFSIKYKDSVDMRYDGKGISTHYNSWVQNLERAIRAHWGSL